MNKKFSTLVATLLLSGALFTLNAAPVGWDADAFKGKVEVVGTTAKTCTFKGNVTMGDFDYLLIDQDDVVIDGNGKELKGHIVITGKNVTVKNLKVTYVNKYAGQMIDGVSYDLTIAKTAITVFAEKATLIDNTITCTAEYDLAACNGISIFPTTKDASFVVKGNTIIAGKISQRDGVETVTASSGIMVTEGYLPGGLQGNVSSQLTTPVSVVGNTFKDCAVDYQYTDYSTGGDGAKEFYFTPLVKNGVVVNAFALQEAVEEAKEDDQYIKFTGTAEDLVKILGETDAAEVPVETTKDGVVVLGPVSLEKTLENGFDFVADWKANEYYMLVSHSEAGNYYIKADENGVLSFAKVEEDTEADDNNIWKMSEALDADGDYTYVFENKAGKKLKVGQDEFLQPVSNVKYNKNGVVFALSGIDLTETTASYFGLYKAGSHKVTAEDMNWFEKGGFSVNFGDVEGTEAFEGRLTAVPNAKDNTKFTLQNKDGKFIAAKVTNVDNTNKDQYIYAFELTEKVAEASEFTFYHTPVNAIDDHTKMTKIDKVTVWVKNSKDKFAEALVGTYNLEGEKTLGASIKYELTPVTITLGNNVVDPKDFLKDKFAVIKQLNGEGAEDDLFVVATGCGEQKITLAEAVDNDLEKQWAISYNPETKTYKVVNRENTAASVEVPYTHLRENNNAGEDYKKDNIYVYVDEDNGGEYEITFVDVDESDLYYKYLSEGTGAEGLADLAEKSFVMSYFSTVFDGSANVSINDKGLAFIGTEAEAAEFTAFAVDTVVAKSLINYWDVTTKEWGKSEPELKAPVYKFNVGNKGFAQVEGKFGLTTSMYDRTALVIRAAGDKFNLAKATNVEGKNTAEFAGKVYAGNNDSYMYSVPCLYDENKNTLFDVNDNNRPEYRRLGKTVKDGLNDVEGDLNILKFFRTNDANQFLYENTMNRNANNGAASLNFLGETNLADKPANAQLPFLVDTAFIRDNTRKPLYLLAVRAGEWAEDEIVVAPCDATNHQHMTADGKPTDDASKCMHATTKKIHSRKGDYLVALDDSLDVKQATYQTNVRLAFVPATHFENDTMVIANSKYTGTEDAANDTLRFSIDGKQNMNAATFAFKLVDRAVDPEGDKASFIIEAAPKIGTTTKRYVRVHNTVPVLVTDPALAAEFEVIAAAEGEEATSNEGIATEGVSVVATNGAVIVKGAEGKNVVITNVLGQQVANTVVSSSEATIAAPAGVVVVAVEGEAAVKAIVK